jgi:hypothetical protein
LQTIALTHTRAVEPLRWVWRGLAAVLCLQPFFQNIILSPIENVPCRKLRPPFLAFFAPFPNSKKPPFSKEL